ncbi:unnamed protein product, partial [Prorocentrum cordatum]
EELRAAARSGWSGVELCAEALASGAVGAAEVSAAVARWRAAGVFAARPPAAALAPESRRTYGVDVGCAAPAYLGRPAGDPRLEGPELERALGSLRRHGLALVAGAVDAEALRALRRRLRIPTGTGPLGCPTEVRTADVAAAAVGAAPPLEPTSGRRHFLLRGTALAEAEILPLLAPLMPLAYRFLAECRPDALPGCLMTGSASEPAAAAAAPRLYLSECQLLVSDPGAAPQMWHRDNQRPGLTVILPLTTVDAEVGPTQLLPGTHAGAWAAASALLESGGAACAAPLEAGQALVYDARVLHRGLGSSSYGHCRVVVVMRLDYVDTPPPGATIAQTALGRVEGGLLQALGALYSALPVPGLADKNHERGVA